MPQSANTTCPSCGAAFHCGVADTDKPCWCMAAPKIMPLAGVTRCLCPACLDREIKLRQAEREAH